MHASGFGSLPDDDQQRALILLRPAPVLAQVAAGGGEGQAEGQATPGRMVMLKAGCRVRGCCGRALCSRPQAEFWISAVWLAAVLSMRESQSESNQPRRVFQFQKPRAAGNNVARFQVEQQHRTNLYWVLRVCPLVPKLPMFQSAAQGHGKRAAINRGLRGERTDEKRRKWKARTKTLKTPKRQSDVCLFVLSDN